MRFCTTSVATLVVIALLSGCSKSDSVAPVDSCQLASTRAQAYSDAVTAYSKAPTPANCTAFKAAANLYLDAAANCATITKAQIDAARASINGSTC